ncbi:MAG: succinyl-diaminopimelate desuccinylase, partial [Vicinamibacterales bacterium]
MAPSPAGDAFQRTRELAHALLACRSVTPDDGGSLELIATRLRTAGFTCERLDRGRVRNLWATHGGASPVVCLAGHVDVVPPGPLDEWTSDPFRPVERNGLLYGRGAADMKGPVAAMVTALERLALRRPDHAGTAALLLTSDEEGDAIDGTAAVVERLQGRGVVLDACLLGEPTSSAVFGDTIKNGRRGSLNGILRLHGVQCHIAYPERGRNPINGSLGALAELATIEWDSGNDYFPPTSFQISNIHGGTGATNVIPGTLDVLFNFRFSPESTPDRLQARVAEVLVRHRLAYDLQWTLSASPYLTPRGPLVDALGAIVQQETGIAPLLSTSCGTSDGRFLAAVAREVEEFG